MTRDEFSRFSCSWSWGFSGLSCGWTGLAGEELGYQDTGNVAWTRNLAFGHRFDYSYDTQHQLKTAVTTDGDTYAARFAYDPGGRVRAVDLDVAPTANVATRHVRYDYPGDLANPTADDAAAVQRLVRTDIVGIDGPVEHASFDYDARGSLVSRTVDGSTRTFTYDGTGRLRRAKHGNRYEIYYYDHRGNRMASARSYYQGESARVRWYVGDSEIWLSSTGVLAKEVTHLSLGAQAVADIRDRATDAPEYTYSGVLGSLLVVADNSSNILASYSYGPYGEVLDSSGANVDDYDRLYNGKPYDDLSGLSYYGFRYYDASTLTWARQDPLYRFAPDYAYDDPRRGGLYTFNLNNPLVYVDPDGREPDVAAGAAAAGAALLVGGYVLATWSPE